MKRKKNRGHISVTAASYDLLKRVSKRRGVSISQFDGLAEFMAAKQRADARSP